MITYIVCALLCVLVVGFATRLACRQKEKNGRMKYLSLAGIWVQAIAFFFFLYAAVVDQVHDGYYESVFAIGMIVWLLGMLFMFAQSLFLPDERKKKEGV